jgi:gliding motility-associated-like protein
MRKLLLLPVLLFSLASFSQAKWELKDPFYDRFFIRNNGQYPSDHGDVVAGVQNDDFNAFIRLDGFNLRQFIADPESEEEREREERGKDRRMEHPMEEVNVYASFLNTASGKFALFGKYDEATFGFRDPSSTALNTINNVAAARVLYVHDLYPNILLTYSFEQPRYGMEYSFQVDPGGDPSQIRIEFKQADKLHIDEKGRLHILSGKGEFVQEAPYAFTGDGSDSEQEVKVAYHLDGKVVSFQLGRYDHSKMLLIDPFLINPNFTNQNKARDCTRDAAGNVYAFGGQNPWKLKKFDSAGNLVWTYNTTYSSWYGDLATDPSGNCFITEGCCGGGMMKVSTNNVILWNQNYGVQEFWCLAFNCDFSNLYLAQGYASNPFVYNSISNVNQSTGVVTGGTAVIGSEPRGLAWGPSGNMYLLGCSSGSSPNQVVGVNSGFGVLFAVASGYALAYNGPAYANGSNPTSGQNGVAAGYNFFCTTNGAVLYKRSLTTGAQLGTLNIPTGVAEGNSGILIDACDNIYVGAQNGIYKYDQNLNLVTSVVTGGPVYCLYPGLNGEIIGSGNGFLGAFAMNYQRNPFTFTTSTVPASCTCNGTASVSVNFTCNNSLPLLYSWNTGATTSSISGLCPGNYTCVIKTNGCLSDTAHVTVVGSSSGGYLVTDIQTNPSCNGGSNGNATATPQGGTGPYTYSWSTTPSQTNATATGLSSGSYTVFITDATGCTGIDTVTITQPPALSINTSFTQPTCSSNNGSITANASGGTGTLTYSWSTSPAQTNATATGLSAGSYTVTVTDANGCTISASVALNSANGPSVNIPSSTNVSCSGGNNGSATANASGGNGPYTYSWSTTPTQTTATATGLTAGSYTILVTDASGCTAAQTISITEPAALSVAPAANQNVSCFGGSNGSVSASGNGGTGPYTFSWSTSQTGPAITGLASGTYTVYITDGNGCTAQGTVQVTQPSQLVLNSNTAPPACNSANGSATVNVNGGSGPYAYSWSTTPAQTSATATGLGAGSYTCTITDANGCTDTSIVSLINPNAPTVQVAAQTNVSCHSGTDGSASVTASGGTGPYTYSWSTTPSQTSASATGLPAGNYVVVVTDATGCTVSMLVSITEPQPLQVNVNNGAGQICIGQGITLTSSTAGGTPSYTYLWSNAGTSSSITVSPTSTTTYTVAATDANGCSDTASTTVTVNPLPVVSLAADDTDACGNLCVNFTTTTAGSLYSWDFGDGGTSTQQNPNHCYTTPGNYSVSLTVTSAAGCSATFIQNNYIHIYPVPAADFAASPITATLLDPTIAFTDLSQGASTWSWSFGDPLNGTSPLQNPSYTYADTGYHTVTLVVTNQFGCRDTDTLSIYIREEFTFYAPNSFTPGKGTLNQVFTPKGIGIDENNYNLWIFDRWGNMIFHSSDLYTGWDGKANGGSLAAQEDVYVWMVELVVRSTHEDKTFIGHVTLIK